MSKPRKTSVATRGGSSSSSSTKAVLSVYNLTERVFVVDPYSFTDRVEENEVHLGSHPHLGLSIVFILKSALPKIEEYKLYIYGMKFRCDWERLVEPIGNLMTIVPVPVGAGPKKTSPLECMLSLLIGWLHEISISKTICHHFQTTIYELGVLIAPT
jgi:hypothetical protein